MQDVSAPIPGRYAAAIGIMEAMHWSWSDLCNAPHDLIDEIAIRLSAKSTWQDRREKMDAQKARSKR
jgi:hypothetical protein